MILKISTIAAILLFAAGNVSAEDDVFDCKVNSDQVWKVYKKGVKDKVGDTVGGMPYKWYNPVDNEFDIKVLELVWGFTGDWSKTAKDPSFQKLKNLEVITYASSESMKFVELLQNRCNLDKSKNYCPSDYSTSEQCMDFYHSRYSKLMTRFDDKVKEMSEVYPMGSRIPALAEKDFSINKDKLVIVGFAIQIPRYSASLLVKQWPMEQVISTTAKQYDTFLNPPQPKLVRGEFETKADFEKRSAKAVSNRNAEAKAASNNAKSKYQKMLSNNMNARIRVLLRPDSIKYDIDNQALSMDIDLVVKNKLWDVDQKSDHLLTLHAQTKVPVERAKMLKEKLSKQDYGEVFEPIKPYLLYEISDNTVALKGAYLVDSTGAKYERVVLRFAEDTSYSRTDKSIAAFDKKLAVALEKNRNDKYIQQTLDHQRNCKNISAAAAYKAPEKYSLIMSINGCN